LLLGLDYRLEIMKVQVKEKVHAPSKGIHILNRRYVKQHGPYQEAGRQG
jgi:hypothetical protein